MSHSNARAIALAYCGAVIGAGFATGREVMDFFSTHGRQGLAGAVLATALFAWAGVIILDVIHQNSVYSYLDFLRCVLLYKPLIIATDMLFLGTLLIGVSVMTAAGGTVLHTWKIWYPAGCAIFLVVCLFILRTGGAGFLKANNWLVPGMTIILAVLCFLQISTPASVLIYLKPLSSSLLYVSFNIAIAAVALSTLKEKLDKRAALWGGLGGGLLIGALLILMYGATVRLTGTSELPMQKVAELWLGEWQWVYSLVLLAAVLTTCLANLHGLATRIFRQGKYGLGLILVAGLGYAVAQYGFARLVGLLYPLLGACNIVLLAGLCYYSLTKLKFLKRNR